MLHFRTYVECLGDGWVAGDVNPDKAQQAPLVGWRELNLEICTYGITASADKLPQAKATYLPDEREVLFFIEVIGAPVN